MIKPFNMLDGLALVLSLGHYHLHSRWYLHRLVNNIRHAFRKRNWVTPGTYKNRNGMTVEVEPNSDNWLDGLPFVVFRNGERLYTVTQDGLVWPGHVGQQLDLVPNI